MNETKEACIRRYFNSWLLQDNSCWDELFAEDIYYSECYGPCYHGLDTLKNWFQHWNQFGKVLEWDIEHILLVEDQASVSWYFHTLYEGEEDAFEGVTLIQFDEHDKMCSVREFQSTLPHVEISMK